MSDFLMQLLTGSTQQSLQDQAALGRSPIALDPEASNLDKAVHALATQRITERIGGLPALGLGFGREVGQGLGQMAQGQPFVGPHGYDPADMKANLVGFHAADSEPLMRALAAITAGGSPTSLGNVAALRGR